MIVLDAVGAGELPDAGDWGDEGSDTLGNVSRAVGGLDLPNLEALGLGNVEPLEGCPPQPGAPAVAGRLVERSKGKDTSRPRPVIVVACNKGRSGTGMRLLSKMNALSQTTAPRI